MDKRKQSRVRRSTASRMKMKELGAVRLVVHRTPRHIYAQVIDAGKVVCSASTVEKSVRESIKYTGNVEAAKHIGGLVAERAIEKGVSKVAFDRSGFQYHGRVQALADAARDKGLQF